MKRKVISLAGLGVRRDRPAVQVDQRLGDGEAEAGSADGLALSAVAAPETLEDVLELLLAQAGPVVGDVELHALAVLARR